VTEEPERDPTDGRPVVWFATPEAFEQWLDGRHREEQAVWVKVAKKGRRVASVSHAEATEVAACFGWVDSKMHRYDADYYVLRFQPRRARSTWTPANRAMAERLIVEGRMRSAGSAAVEAAKAEGRWD
jgi:uncharacterized protein YdeI (YjbR/CyaY-like superfamily)